jgi:polyhydroxyalkanoate synthase
MTDSTERLAAHSADAILGPNPIVGFRARDVFREGMRTLRVAAAQPYLTARTVSHFAQEMRKVLTNASKLEPSPRDRRFSDAAWKSDPRYRHWLQSWLALEKSLAEWVEGQDLKPHSRARLEFMLSLLTDAVAPSNFPWQPEAVRRFRDSGGLSAFEGLRNLARDLRENKGLPAQVDKRSFKVGGNLATTAGDVVLQTEVMELIQYRPTTAQVHEIPVLIVPPQINKFYIFDLTSEKSVVRGLLDAGMQVFIVSWRNPTAACADWGLAEYAAAIDMSIATICQLAHSSRVNLMGACAGGITLAAYVAARAAARDLRVNTLTLLVSVLDVGELGETPLGLFATPSAIEAARKKSAKAGVLDGRAMAAAFAWLRPNDLIWNYWINNVLLGNAPPAFDILYWNNDYTRLPAQLHSEFMDVFSNNSLSQNGVMRLHGVPVDLRKITCDSYVLGGTTDHITPWKACYRNTQLFGGNRSFVLANAGHMQSILSPPGSKKAEFWTGGTLADTADAWRASAEHHGGSWWPHWHSWLHERSGALRAAPASSGNEDYPVLYNAPGRYVYE